MLNTYCQTLEKNFLNKWGVKEETDYRKILRCSNKGKIRNFRSYKSRINNSVRQNICKYVSRV